MTLLRWIALSVVLASVACADDTTPPASGNAEVFRNVVITAGKSLALDSTLDYSSGTTVAVTVKCSTCTDAESSLGSSGLGLQARWIFPNADFDIATESKSATTFLYWDVGAAIFAVYGPQFRLVLVNKGTKTLTLQQVTLFRRSGPAS